MKWATVFEQVAARPDSLAEIARLYGVTPDEILAQVALQTTCHGANYDAARRAQEALARRPEESEAYKKLKEETRKKLEEEVKDKLKEKAEEEAKKAWEEQKKRAEAQRQQQAQQQAQQERARQLREQAQREQAQREQAQRQQQARQQTKPRSGCSRGVRWLLGAVVVVAALLVLGYIAKQGLPTSPIGSGNTPAPAVTPTCPPQVAERRKCPWSPDNYSVEPCPPGFCYDAGPQGSLSCKQEVAPENSYRDYYSSVQCNDGYTAERDPCTGVILRCVKQ